MESIYDKFKDLKKGDIVYSPIIGDMTFEFVNCNSEGIKMIYGSVIPNSNKSNYIYMFGFDEFGRYIVTNPQEKRGECLLFISKKEFLEYYGR